MVRGGGVDGTSPLEFWKCCLQWKAFDLVIKMRYILLVVALLEVFDVTKHGRHLGFYQELEIR